MVRLTPAGRALADRAIEIHFRKLAAQLVSLSRKDRRALLDGLSKLLHSLECADANPDRHDES